MKQSKKLINLFACFCPIENLFYFEGNNIGFEEIVASSMKVFQTFLRLRLEEEDKLISIHFDEMIEVVCRSRTPKVVEYFMTKLTRFDSIKAIDDIKNFKEKYRQWL